MLGLYLLLLLLLCQVICSFLLMASIEICVSVVGVEVTREFCSECTDVCCWYSLFVHCDWTVDGSITK